MSLTRTVTLTEYCISLKLSMQSKSVFYVDSFTAE